MSPGKLQVLNSNYIASHCYTGLHGVKLSRHWGVHRRGVLVVIELTPFACLYSVGILFFVACSMNQPPYAERAWLYFSCVAPSLLFCVSPRSSCKKAWVWLRASLVIMQLLMPLCHDGQHGDLIDLAVVATFSCFTAFSMILAIQDGSDKPLQTVISRWYARSPPSKSVKTPLAHEAPSLPVIRRYASSCFIRGLVYFAISVPTMAFLDGFLRVCAAPLQTPYLDLFSSEPQRIPVRTLYYYAVAGIALLGHIAIVPTFVLLYRSGMLFIKTFFCEKLQAEYEAMLDFMTQPTLFDDPWLACSIHELWSR